MPGEYFDEWQVGETIGHPLRRTLTETDNLLWSAMTRNSPTSTPRRSGCACF
jgi:acyl dehydratase